MLDKQHNTNVGYSSRSDERTGISVRAHAGWQACWRGLAYIHSYRQQEGVLFRWWWVRQAYRHRYDSSPLNRPASSWAPFSVEVAAQAPISACYKTLAILQVAWSLSLLSCYVVPRLCHALASFLLLALCRALTFQHGHKLSLSLKPTIYDCL